MKPLNNLLLEMQCETKYCSTSLEVNLIVMTATKPTINIIKFTSFIDTLNWTVGFPLPWSTDD